MSSNKLKSLFKTTEQLLSVARNSVSSQSSSNTSHSNEDGSSPAKQELQAQKMVEGTKEAEGFLCPQCLCAFPNADLLTEHFSSEHSVTTDSAIQCDQCKMKLNSEHELRTHVEKYHNIQPEVQFTATLSDKTQQELSDKIQQELADKFNRLVQLSTTAGASKMTSEEITLLERQQKALEETKDLLLKELATMRTELQKKDELVEKLESSFVSEKQAMVEELKRVKMEEKVIMKNHDKDCQSSDSGKTEEGEYASWTRETLINKVKEYSNRNEIQQKLIQTLKNQVTSCQNQLDDLPLKLISECDERFEEEEKKFTSEKEKLLNKITELEDSMTILKNNNFALKNQNELLISSCYKTDEQRYLQMEKLKNEEIERNRHLAQHYQHEISLIRSHIRSRCRIIQDQVTFTRRDMICMSTLFPEMIKQVLGMLFNFYQNVNSQFQFGDLQHKLQETTAKLELMTKQHATVENKLKQYKMELDLWESTHEKKVEIIQDELNINSRKTLEKVQEEHEEQIEQLKTKLNSVRNEYKKDLNKKISDLSISLNKATNDYKDLYLKYDKESFEWKRKHEKLLKEKSKVDNLYNELINEKIPEQKNQIEDLNQQLTHLQKELNELTTKHSKEIQKYQNQYQTLAKDKSSLENKCQSLTDDLNVKMKELQKSTDDYTDLREKIIKLEEKERELLATQATLSKQIDDLKSGQESTKKALTLANQEKINLIAKIEKHEARLEDAKQQQDKVLSDKLRLEVELSTCIEEKRALLERCVASEEQLGKTNKEITDLSRKLDENVRAVHELGMQNQTLQIQIEELNIKQKRAWANDRLVDKCMNQACDKLFTTVVRKHHCRQCGNIFCNDCSTKTAQLTGHPKPVRVCDQCYQEIIES